MNAEGPAWLNERSPNFVRSVAVLFRFALLYMHRCTAGCEYGDRATWCSSVGVTASRCTPSDLGEQCCGTCNQLVPGGVQQEPTNQQPATNADCPQGDQASYCATIASENCYSAAQTCCISCAKYKTNIPGTSRRAVQAE